MLLRRREKGKVFFSDCQNSLEGGTQGGDGKLKSSAMSSGLFSFVFR